MRHTLRVRGVRVFGARGFGGMAAVRVVGLLAALPAIWLSVAAVSPAGLAHPRAASQPATPQARAHQARAPQARAAQARASQSRAAQSRAALTAPTLAPCEWRRVEGRVDCGTLTVPENRDKPGGRQLSIYFVVARATGEPAGEPVFFFTGGPGSAATMSAAAYTEHFARLRAARDFVFIDQRGTGRSAPLACAPRDEARRGLRPLFGREAAAACRAALERGADLRLYTTADAARDVDDVRRALGYRRINLHGASYGTRAAWEYAALYPSRTRAIVLHGPVPPGFYTPLPFARGLDTALDGVIAACAADAPCAARFPSLARDVARAFDRLREKPARVRLRDGDGPAIDATLTHSELAEAVRYELYTPARAADLPSLLTKAAAGDYSAIANVSLANRVRLGRDLTDGMYLSVTCAEDIPFLTRDAIRAGTAGTRLGDYRVRQQVQACREWPRGAAPGAHLDKPLEPPALVLVGEFDPATPPGWAERALDRLPNGRAIVIPNGAHGFAGLGIDRCLAGLTTTFLTRGSAQGLDASCVDAARRPPFNLE